MHVISESTIDRFVRAHAEAAPSMTIWLRIVKPARFRTFHDVRRLLPRTDALANGVVVFDIGGNRYRISASIRYANEKSRVGRIYIRHVMTHAEYTTRSREGTL